MVDNQRELELERKLKRVKESILAGVPDYLASACGSQRKSHHEKYKHTHRVLGCSVKLADRFQLGFHAASVMYEAVLNLEENKCEDLHCLMVKTMPDSAMLRKIQNSSDQFFNESMAYSEIIPLLLKTCTDLNVERLSLNLSAVSDLFPKCYYASADPENGIMVLQNLRVLGYRIAGDKLMLMDFDHIVLALEGLARFHALSYASKKKDLRMYEERVVTQIRDGRGFVKKRTSDALSEGYQIALGGMALSTFDAFDEKQLEEGGQYTERLEMIRRRVENCTELIRELLTPEEPLAVLCHGDFNRNNMMFRYGSDGKPSAVKFIDFQTPFYASPAIDLSFFLFVNASPELWTSRWDDMFSAYHRTLLDALSEFLNCSQETLLPEFSLEAFERQFSKYLLYGFLLATCFIVSNAEDPDKVKAFEWFNDGVPTLDDIAHNAQEMVSLVKDEVIDRLLPLTRELLDKISP
jgi:hypothetical protein